MKKIKDLPKSGVPDSAMPFLAILMIRLHDTEPTTQLPPRVSVGKWRTDGPFGLKESSVEIISKAWQYLFIEYKVWSPCLEKLTSVHLFRFVKALPFPGFALPQERALEKQTIKDIPTSMRQVWISIHYSLHFTDTQG